MVFLEVAQGESEELCLKGPNLMKVNNNEMGALSKRTQQLF